MSFGHGAAYNRGTVPWVSFQQQCRYRSVPFDHSAMHWVIVSFQPWRYSPMPFDYRAPYIRKTMSFCHFNKDNVIYPFHVDIVLKTPVTLSHCVVSTTMILYTHVIWSQWYLHPWHYVIVTLTQQCCYKTVWFEHGTKHSRCHFNNLWHFVIVLYTHETQWHFNNHDVIYLWHYTIVSFPQVSRYMPD